MFKRKIIVTEQNPAHEQSIKQMDEDEEIAVVYSSLPKSDKPILKLKETKTIKASKTKIIDINDNEDGNEGEKSKSDTNQEVIRTGRGNKSKNLTSKAMTSAAEATSDFEALKQEFDFEKRLVDDDVDDVNERENACFLKSKQENQIKTIVSSINSDSLTSQQTENAKKGLAHSSVLNASNKSVVYSKQNPPSVSIIVKNERSNLVSIAFLNESLRQFSTFYKNEKKRMNQFLKLKQR